MTSPGDAPRPFRHAPQPTSGMIGLDMADPSHHAAVGRVLTANPPGRRRRLPVSLDGSTVPEPLDPDWTCEGQADILDELEDDQ